MKTTTYLKISLMALASFGALTSCVKNDEFDVPKFKCDNQFEAANSSITAVKQLAPTPAPPTYESNHVITDDIIFDGYVISSDEGGNFYKQLTIQDNPENPTAGIQIAINKSNLYTDYPVGAHIRVRAKGLSVGEDRGVVKLGYEKPTGQIQEAKMIDFISGVCGGDKMDIAAIKPMVYDNLTDALTDENINTLVTIKNVQFAEADGKLTYADVVNNLNSDRTLIDKDGNKAVLRNSGYARFAGKIMPQESGDITVVVSKYTSGKNVTWQLYIRDLNDVKFDQPRFVLSSSILGGGALDYKTTFTEDFSSVAVSGKFKAVDDPKYLNYSVYSNRFWEKKDFGGNDYIQMSAFKTKEDVQTYFIVPVTFNNASKLSFQTKDGFNNGDVLKVYYTTDYTPGSALDKSKLVDITSKFTIASGTNKGYASSWTDSGEYTIPTNGKGYIFFEYVGNTSVTTTMQVDNITVK